MFEGLMVCLGGYAITIPAAMQEGLPKQSKSCMMKRQRNEMQNMKGKCIRMTILAALALAGGVQAGTN
ncbi:MAG: hypothetical protein IJJ84_08065, partial [Kiritimatiellae bacterium]|nr:hypothetical protein [Kiritimatiellia bacterium]